jgi:hypothetical protein
VWATSPTQSTAISPHVQQQPLLIRKEIFSNAKTDSRKSGNLKCRAGNATYPHFYDWYFSDYEKIRERVSLNTRDGANISSHFQRRSDGVIAEQVGRWPKPSDVNSNWQFGGFMGGGGGGGGMAGGGGGCGGGAGGGMGAGM